MSIPQYTVLIADGDRVPQMTIRIAEEGDRAQCRLRVAEEGDRAQLTVRVALEGDRAQLTAVLEGYTPQVDYVSRVLTLSPVVYYPLAEASGTTALDAVGDLDGTYSGAVPGGAGIGDGNTAASFDGTGDVIDASAAIGVLSGDTGSVALWAKADTWSNKVLLRLFANAGNLIQIAQSSGELVARRIGDETSKLVGSTTVGSTSNYIHIAFTWSVSANQLKLYINGIQTGPTTTGLDPFAAALVSLMIGATNISGANSWSGTIAHVALFDRVLTAQETLDLGVL